MGSSSPGVAGKSPKAIVRPDAAAGKRRGTLLPARSCYARSCYARKSYRGATFGGIGVCL
jgi:hypothetical protein